MSENLSAEVRVYLFRSTLKEGGVFILEHGKQKDFTNVPHFVEHRAYGSVNFSIFK